MAWIIRILSQGYSCNPQLLKHLRESKNWTQAELSKATGYSIRLISKAEAGRSISPVAIDTLAEALSTSVQTIYPEDLISDPVLLAKAYVAALYIHQKNIFEAIKHFVDDDIFLRVSGDPAIIPFAGQYRGIAEFERGLSILFLILEAPVNHDHEPWYTYVATGNRVAVWGKTWLHPIGIPTNEPMPICYLMKFRRGKLFQIAKRFDTLQAAKALFKIGVQP
jgi:transcriptional regulator with XRE-family HTH domain